MPIQNLKAKCHQLIPPTYWTVVMSSLARSIELVHQADPSKWGIRFRDARDYSIMLKIGPHEVFQVLPWKQPQVHLIVDRATVPTPIRAMPELQFSQDLDWYGNEGVAGYYPSNPGSEACNMQFSELEKVYDDLFPSHSEVVRRAAKMRRLPNTSTTHCPELVALIATEAGCQLAQPTY